MHHQARELEKKVTGRLVDEADVVCATCLSSAGFDLHQVPYMHYMHMHMHLHALPLPLALAWICMPPCICLDLPCLGRRRHVHQGSSGRGFTHVLMDEAAQTSEVSALVPIAQVCGIGLG
jgi:hypothetical protein